VSSTEKIGFASLAEDLYSLLDEFGELLRRSESFEQAHVELVSCLDFDSDDKFVTLSEADGYLAFYEALDALRELAQGIEDRLWRTGRARASAT
jgi:hypothetical protein